MKLKEKLAKDYATFQSLPDQESYNLCEKNAFLAGFEKAREMAKIKINKDFEGFYMVKHGLVNGIKTRESFPISLGDALNDLGEEEVENDT